MNLKKTVARFAFVSMLTIILAVTLVAAQPYHNWLAPGPSAKVDSHWWDITVDDDVRLEKALACELDLLGVPYPEAMDDLDDAGFTLTSSQSDGYTFIMSNNRVWPTGDTAGTGLPTAANGWRAMNFRKALHRLIPKAACVALFAPLNSACEWWGPPIQAYWLNPAAPTPTFDPIAANAYLDAAGFTEDSSLGANPDYDPDFLWSAQYLRKDPVYGGPIAFEYYAIGPVEAPIGFEMAQLVASYYRKAGLTVDLVAGTWLGMVIRLTNADFYDYQFMTGIGITGMGIAPDFMYDVTYSENMPLWNFAGMNISSLDEAGLRMMSTLDLAKCRQAAFDIQTLMSEYEPFMPMLLWNNFIASKGPSRAYQPGGPITWPDAPGSHPGLVGIVVDQRGGAAVSANVFGKMLTRGDRLDLPNPNEERNLWGAGAYLDTLNPLMADTVPDWQTLANLFEGFYSRNPYTMDYMWWGAEYAPAIEEWIGPGRKQIGGNEVYDATYNGTHYDGIPIADVTEDDLVNDDQLGMVVTWKIREGMYWHDSNPGPDGKFETADDGTLYEVTAEDYCFGMNLLRDQENDRYQTQWWFVYAVEEVDEFTVKVCEERRFLFAFEGHDVGFLAPKHIWESFIEPVYDVASLAITLPDGTISYGDEIIDWTRHHDTWEGWEEPYMQDPGIRDPITGAISTDPRFMLTKLIGFGPFKYHMGGWEVGIGSHFEANRQYFAHTICVGDIDFSKTVELPDLYAVMASVGEYKADPNYNVAADICYPAQVIDSAEIYAVQIMHFSHYWGPPPLPGGFEWCDCSTCAGQ